jgi:hypothetical protein
MRACGGVHSCAALVSKMQLRSKERILIYNFQNWIKTKKSGIKRELTASRNDMVPMV